jgi:hypothetical protein
LVQREFDAQDPALRALIVALLNELQPEVDECHQSEKGQKLLKMLEDQRKLQEAVACSRMEDMLTKKTREQETTDTAKELSQLTSHDLDVIPDGKKRSRRPVERLDLSAYEDEDDDEYIACSKTKSSSTLQKTTREEDDSSESECNAADSESEDNDVDSGPLYSDSESEYNEPDSENGSEDESLIISTAGNPRGQIIAAKFEAIIRKEAAFREFISETQPDDETRHRLALLQMPQAKKYTEDDLQDEFTMRVGLHLLYNKIHGKTELHLGKSIHIRYWTFPKDVIAITEKKVQTTLAQKKVAEKLAR